MKKLKFAHLGMRYTTQCLRSARAASQVCLGLLLCVAGVAQAQQNSHPILRPGYVGDATCLECHKDVGESYARTAHHLTSQLPGAESIRGHFEEGSNVLTIIDAANGAGLPSLQFRMDREGDRFFETVITGYAPHLYESRESIDLVTGSGKRGQTYLYWHGDKLFELPVSYWSDGAQWINSPGYRNGTADFSRPVQAGCMECHSTYLRPLYEDPFSNRFDRSTLVPGISCETCHGPGADHAAKERKHLAHAPNIGDKSILNPSRFSRDRQLDLCAWCHNGIQRKPLTPAFSYMPGKPLADFFTPLQTAPVEHPDVHGNQVGLLERSRCFKSSPNMTCSTCHDTHAQERPAASYSSRCLTCHQWQTCGVAKALGEKIKSNCIDCHMPNEPTAVIVPQTAGHEVHASMRDHWIKVYPGAHLP